MQTDANDWVTDLSGFLDNKGHLLITLSAEKRQWADMLCQAVVYATTRKDSHCHAEGEVCTHQHEIQDDTQFSKRPPCAAVIEGQACSGLIDACLSMEDEFIDWFCVTCGLGGLIGGWENTLWDLRERDDILH